MPESVRRVLYLCGAIEPHREGISKEVFSLRRHFHQSYVVGTSPQGRFTRSRHDRYLAIPPRFLPTLRYWIRLVARNFDLVHIFHGIDGYHYLKAKGEMPLIITAISVDQVLSMDHYQKLRAVVVESCRDREKLIRHGFDPEKVEVIYPGSDLSHFNDSVVPPEGRFRVLFASSPFSLAYMEPRGVRLLLKAASELPEVEFVLLWRKGCDTVPLLTRWMEELAVTNVTVINEDIRDMSRFYRETHATVLPFTSEKHTKSCPNSAVESLATGRPVLVSEKVGIAELVQAERCGVVFQPDPAGLVEAIRMLKLQYETVQKNARPTADRHFDLRVFLSRYERLYATVGLT